MMTERQQKLLALLQHKKWMSTKDIAWALHCSERTVRTELRALEKLSDVQIETSRGKGVRLLENHYVPIQEREHDEGRVEQILIRLLFDEIASLAAIASTFYISEATVRQDIDTIEQMLKDSHFTFDRRHCRVDGEELLRREWLTQLLVKTRSPQAHVQDVRLIETFLTYWEREVDKQYSDTASELLQARLLVSLKRMRRRAYVTLSPSGLEMARATRGFDKLMRRMDTLEQSLGMKIPTEERAYFMLALSGAQEFNPSEDHVTPEVARAANRFALAVNGTIYGGALQRELYRSLLAHIRPMVYRQLIKAYVENPLLDQIKRRFTATYAAVLRHASILESELDLYVTEDEVGFLTLHFQTMLEERRGQEKKRILLVCTYGMGTSKLIAARLHNQFHDAIHIVGYSSLRELDKQIERCQPDLIVSTVQLGERETPVHVVSAVLTEQDVHQLRQLVGVNGNTYATIASLVEHVRFVDDVLSRGHALHVLMEAAHIDEHYSESVYNRERNGSTSIGQSVAIPHGDPELATTNRIDVLVSQTPIAWGGEQVRLIFLLQFRDSDQTFSTHLFEEIAALTENPKLVRELVESKDPRAFRDLLLP